MKRNQMKNERQDGQRPPVGVLVTPRVFTKRIYNTYLQNISTYVRGLKSFNNSLESFQNSLKSFGNSLESFI